MSRVAEIGVSNFGGIEANGKSAASDCGAMVDGLVEHELMSNSITHRLTAQSVSSAGAQTFVHLGNHFIILLLLRFWFAGRHVFQKLAFDESPRLASMVDFLGCHTQWRLTILFPRTVSSAIVLCSCSGISPAIRPRRNVSPIPHNCRH